MSFDYSTNFNNFFNSGQKDNFSTNFLSSSNNIFPNSLFNNGFNFNQSVSPFNFGTSPLDMMFMKFLMGKKSSNSSTSLNANLNDPKYKLKKSEYTDMITRVAQEQGVDPKLMLSIVQAESTFNPAAESPCGAFGLAQLMPSTAKWLGVDIYDPEDNVRGGAKYIKSMLKKYNGNKELAIAAYNAGPTAVDKSNGIPNNNETPEYVKKVLGAYNSVA